MFSEALVQFSPLILAHQPYLARFPKAALGTSQSSKSPEYIAEAIPICFLLLKHWACWAFLFAEASAGRSIAARIAIMAITTSNSINVNAPACGTQRARRRRKNCRIIILFLNVIFKTSLKITLKGTSRDARDATRRPECSANFERSGSIVLQPVEYRGVRRQRHFELE